MKTAVLRGSAIKYLSIPFEMHIDGEGSEQFSDDVLIRGQIPSKSRTKVEIPAVNQIPVGFPGHDGSAGCCQLVEHVEADQRLEGNAFVLDK